MRTITEMSKRKVAIDAEHTQTKREPLFFESLIKIFTRSQGGVQFSSMLTSVPIDMVNRKKLHMLLPATYTNCATICLKNFKFQALSISSLSLSLFCGVFPRHKNTASHQLATLSYGQADERQLGVIIA